MKKKFLALALCFALALSVFSLPIAVSAAESGKTVTAATAKGDVNLDGNFDVRDATAVKRYVAKLITLTNEQKKIADVDKNGDVDVRDATKMQRIIAKLDTFLEDEQTPTETQPVTQTQPAGTYTVYVRTNLSWLSQNGVDPMLYDVNADKTYKLSVDESAARFTFKATVPTSFSSAVFYRADSTYVEPEKGYNQISGLSFTPENNCYFLESWDDATSTAVGHMGTYTFEPYEDNAVSTIYVLDDEGWGNVFFYGWGEYDSSKTIAGTPIGDNYYKFELDPALTPGVTTFLFKNTEGNKTWDKQTLNLAVKSGKNLYTLSTDRWSVYGSSTPEPTEPEETVRVYFANDLLWYQPYVYAWNTASQDNGEWPGEPMIKGADGRFYFDVPKKFSKIIFNEGKGGDGKTDDLDVPRTDNMTCDSKGNWTAPEDTTQPVTQLGETIRVYFANDLLWYQPYAYAWDNSSNENAAWPGEPMKKDASGRFYCDVSRQFTKIIFNEGVNGSGKTDDLDLPKEDNMTCDSKGNWTSPEDATQPATQLSDTVKVYFSNDKGWKNVYAYVWDNSSNYKTKWPGDLMTADASSKLYFEVPRQYNHIIFNDGDKTKTTDLDMPKTSGMTCDSNGVWTAADGTTQPATQATEPTQPATQATEPTQPATTAETVKVYFANDKNWSAPKIYLWNDKGDKNANWPGEDMKKDASGRWYFDIPSKYTHVIFNDGNSAQTADLDVPKVSGQTCDSSGNWSEGGTTPSTDTIKVYFSNDKSWSTPKIYLWNDMGDKNANWPGEDMKKDASGKWYFDIPSKYTHVIFNDGNGAQTADLDVPSVSGKTCDSNGNWT
ncbi:MAG: starch-binding protein [Ruminococcus sp.]|nr:starch-binding protein [Ruminococcus sp.]